MSITRFQVDSDSFTTLYHVFAFLCLNGNAQSLSRSFPKLVGSEIHLYGQLLTRPCERR